MQSRLTPLQTALLDAFFRHEKRFFLTGGAALAGFHLGHRETQDLDLFVASEDERVLEEGESALQRAASDLGGSVEVVRTAIDFRRRLVKSGEKSVLVDLVRDRVPQLGPKSAQGEILVDPPREILANKLCTLVSRSEVRDLIDVRALEATGLSIESALHDASKKDAGISPAILSWILSSIAVPDGRQLPAGVAAPELRRWIDHLRETLAKMAWPTS